MGLGSGIVLVAGAVACAASVGGSASIPAGAYEMEADAGERTLPISLELLSVAGRPWGRLTVPAGGENARIFRAR